MTGLRALTLKQPWAHMVAHCGKPVENRSWKAPDWLGEFAIHAGARSGWDSNAELSGVALRAWRDWAAGLPPMNVPGPLSRNSIFIDYGAIVAVVTLKGCHLIADDCYRPGRRGHAIGVWPCSEWAVPGQWHWQLSDVRPLAEPVPCKGALGLWKVPGDVESAVRAQLDAKGNA